MAELPRGGALFSLEGKLAFVTGSNGGLGLAIARGMAEAGATVIIHGRNQEKVDKAVAELKADGLTVHGYTFDLTEQALVDAGVARIESEVGPIHILVNNAGINLRGRLDTLPHADFERTMHTNVTCPFYVAQSVVSRMIARKQPGKVINICSLMSEVARPNVGCYTASKGAIKNLTKGMATDWGPHGIQVNGIGPGYFETDITAPLKADETFNTWLCKRTPMGRWGDVKELVGPAVFLASSASSWVNGHVLYVDGGILATI